MRNRAGVFAEFIVAQVSEFLDEVDFAEEPQRALHPVRVLVDGLDCRGLQHGTNELFGAESRHGEGGPRVFDGFLVLATFQREMFG